MEEVKNAVDASALFQFTYGLFVLTAREGDRDNGCIINTAMQITDNPKQIMIAVNKANLTHVMIKKTGIFNLSVLTEAVPFQVFQHFGMQSGKTVDKFAECKKALRSANGVYYLPHYINAFLSGKVIETVDCATHTLFIAEVSEAQVLSNEPSVTYAYYFAHIKPKPQPTKEKKSVTCARFADMCMREMNYLRISFVRYANTERRILSG